MRSPIEPGRGGAGFVLLEAVVALVILSLFGLALLSAVSAQVRTADKANTLLVARFLADDRLTALQLLDHEGLARLPDSLAAGRFPPPLEAYSWTVTSALADEQLDLFDVRVVVSGHGEAYPLHTWLHRPGAVTALQGGAAGGFVVGGGGARGGGPGGPAAGPAGPGGQRGGAAGPQGQRGEPLGPGQGGGGAGRGGQRGGPPGAGGQRGNGGGPGQLPAGPPPGGGRAAGAGQRGGQ